MLGEGLTYSMSFFFSTYSLLSRFTVPIFCHTFVADGSLSAGFQYVNCVPSEMDGRDTAHSCNFPEENTEERWRWRRRVHVRVQLLK